MVIYSNRQNFGTESVIYLYCDDADADRPDKTDIPALVHYPCIEMLSDYFQIFGPLLRL